MSLDLIGQLRKSVLRLKADFISEDGSTVNYQAMGNSEAFEEYKKLAGNLKFLDLEALKSQEQERKAFFINLYNKVINLSSDNSCKAIFK